MSRNLASGKTKSVAVAASGSTSSLCVRRSSSDSLQGVSADDFYFAVNAVRPSYIRVEADEATYNLHIILRFELEQALISGDLEPADVPGAWNDRFQKLLGLTPATFRQGCMQDIHWSFGGIGYFPTYTLGNLYAAQFMDQARGLARS